MKNIETFHVFGNSLHNLLCLFPDHDNGNQEHRKEN